MGIRRLLVKKPARKPLIVAWMCLAVILAALFFRFVLVSEEKRIELTVKDAIRAVWEEDAQGCMEHIALTEWDTSAATREELEAVIQEGFDTFDNIRVLYDELTAEVLGEEATVRMKVKVTARYDEQVILLLGTITEGREIELGMVKAGRKWLISSISGVEIPVDVLEEF